MHNHRLGALPALQGTPEEVALAHSVRAYVLDVLGEVIGLSVSENPRHSLRHIILANALRAYWNNLTLPETLLPELEEIIRDEVIRQSRADWWISLRNKKTLGDLLRAIHPLVVDRVCRPKQCVDNNPFDPDLFVIPGKEMDRRTIVALRLSDQRIVIEAPKRLAPLVPLLRKWGFAWSRESETWHRTILPWMGDIEDFYVGVSQAVVCQGFSIEVCNADLKRRVIEGQVEPLRCRWIDVVNCERWTGWYLLSWGPDEDLSSALDDLPGCIGRRPEWSTALVAPRAILAVADFATTYGFRLSPAFSERLSLVEDGLRKGETIETLIPKPILPSREKTLSPTMSSIDDDLLDEEFEEIYR